MRLQTHHRPVELDLDRCQSALAQRPGTLLLHTGVDWRGSGRSALLFAPRWTWRQRRGEPARLEGFPPAGLDPHRSPLRWPFEHFVGGDRETAAPCFCGVAGYYSYECGLGGDGVQGVPGDGVQGVPGDGVQGVPGDGVAAGAGIRPASRALFDIDDVWLGAYDRALVVEPDGRLVLHVADLGPLDTDPRALDERWTEAYHTLAQAQAEPAPIPQAEGSSPTPRFFSREWHRDRVGAIRRHLRAGDCYQINLTGFASARTGVDPHRAFLRETQRNPVAFAAFLRTSDAVITSHSPERLLLLRGDRAETAPIKGTLDRGARGADALLRSAKDAAEHVMIVDLCRNDLGRNARYGSVEVPQLREALELRGLVHMISRVTARIAPGRRAHVFESLFPGGSITGAPKRRAMQIISELETFRRGPYTGSIGYLDVHGRADWNIAIRTAVWQDGRVHFGCGGGIVLDSDPDAEYEEALLKASSFFDSLREIQRAASPSPAISSPGTTP